MRLIRPTTIAGKLIATFILLSLIWCLLCGYAIGLLLSTDAANGKLLEQQAIVIDRSKDIQLQTAMQSYSLASYMAAVSAGSLGDRKSQEALMAANDKVKGTLDELRTVIAERESHEKLSAMEQNNEQFAQVAEQIMGLSQDNRVKAEVLMQTDARRLSTIIIQDANELTRQQQQLVRGEQLHNREQIEVSITTMIWGAVLLLLASIAGSYYVSRRLTKPIVRIVGYTQQVAQGNLQSTDWQIASRDEIGMLYQNFIVMSNNLRELIANMAESSATIIHALGQWNSSVQYTASSSRAIAEAMQQVQSAFLNQHKELAITFSSATEVAAGVEQIDGVMTESVAHFDNVLELTATSGADMEQTAQQMVAIKEAVGRVESQFQELQNSAKQIGGIIEMISAIAKQTNLLAINASIEASRAGVYGKGFAVIAKEIGALSQQSGQSAVAAGQVLEQIRDNISRMNQSITFSVGQVEAGIYSMHQAEAAFHSISSTIMRSASEISKVSTATQQIRHMVEMMRGVFQQMNLVTIDTAKKTEEVAAEAEEQLATMEQLHGAAERLSLLAEGLDHAVKRFRL